MNDWVSGSDGELSLRQEGVKILGGSEEGEARFEVLVRDYAEAWDLHKSSGSLASLDEKLSTLAQASDSLAVAVRGIDPFARLTFLKNTKESRGIWGRAGGDRLLPRLLEGAGFGVYSTWEALKLPRDGNILDLFSPSELSAFAELSRYWASNYAALQKEHIGQPKASSTLVGRPNEQLAVDCAFEVFGVEGGPRQAGRLMWIVLKTVRKTEIKKRSAERERQQAVRLAEQLASHRPPSD